MFEIILTTSTWITWTILHFIWMGFAVWILTLAYRLLFPSTRPYKLYRINLMGLIALIGCLPAAAIFGAWQLEADIIERQQAALKRNAPIVQTATASKKLLPSETKSQPGAAPLKDDSKQDASGASQDTPASPISGVSKLPELADRPAESSSIQETVSKIAPWITICYFVGMLLMMCRLMVMMVGCRRIKQGAFTKEDTEFLKRLTAIAKKLGVRTPAFRLTTRVSSPMVVGLLKPMLLVPATLVSGMTTAELEAVLIHELAHLRRYDHFVVILRRVAEAIFFFHPVVWYFSRGLSQTQELCCDDIVLAQGIQPLDYARGLCHVAEFSQNKNAPNVLPALAATGESPSELLVRVRRILGDSAKVKIGPSRFATLVFAGLILAPVVAISAMALTPPVDYDLINSIRSVPSGAQTQIQKDEFRVNGRVVDEAGNPVANAIVRGAQPMEMHVQSKADESGEFEIEFNTAFDAMVIVYSPDKKTIGTIRLNREQAAASSAKPVEVKLAPAIEHVVTVTKDGQSVSDAWVWSGSPGDPFAIAQEKTSGKGEARLVFPQGAKPFSVMCWHETMGVNSIAIPSESQKPSLNLEIALLPTRKCKTLVLDENEQPVANISVFPLLNGKGENLDFLGVLALTSKKTDANGEVEFHWLPPLKDYDFKPGVYGSKEYSWNQVRTLKLRGTSNTVRHVYVDRNPVKKTVKGKLVGGEGDLKNIRISGRGYKDDTSDYFESFSNSKGEFELELVPGMQYSIGVTNDFWASDVGVIQAFENKEVSLNIYPATPITVTLTSGKNKTPVKVGGIQYTVKAPSSGLSPKWVIGVKEFNENGQLVFGAPEGYIELRVNAEGWHLEKMVRVQRGKPQNLNIHAKAIGMRTVTGKVKGPAGVELANCEIQIKDQYQRRKWAPVKTKADGSWSAEVDSQQVAVSAFTADKKYGGIGFTKELGEEMSTIKLRPTVTVSGVLLDETGLPIKDAEVCQYYETQPLIGRSNRMGYIFTRTDKDGAFEFNGVITGYPQKLCLMKTRGSYTYIGNNKVYRPGEDVTGIRAVYVDYHRRERELRETKLKTPKAAPNRVPLSDQIRLLGAKCDAESMHGLVMIAPDDPVVKKQVESFLKIPPPSSVEIETQVRTQTDVPILHFIPRALTASPETSKASIEHLAKLKVKMPKDKQLVCFVIDGAGEKIAHQTFDTTQANLKAAFDKFLTENLPAKRDARQLYESALAQAAKEDKNVFIKIGGPRCSPCLKMGAWLNSQLSIFEKDYVMFHFHPERSIGGAKLAKELCKNYGGVPWCTILDKDGKEIINSDGPLGNIGFPVGNEEGINHFISMLEKSRKNLTDEDLLTLQRSLASPK